MKKLALIVILALTSTLSFASNYPEDYFNQVAKFNSSNDHVLFGSVSSGVMSPKYIIGYKNSGIFGDRDFIDVIMTVTCKEWDKSLNKRTQVLKLERELHGTGFMSMPLDLNYYACSGGYGPQEVALAFSSKGEWDSLYGANYVYTVYNWTDVLKSKSSVPTGEIGSDMWDFIVNLMRK